jgi:Recombination endonuclease VII
MPKYHLIAFGSPNLRYCTNKRCWHEGVPLSLDAFYDYKSRYGKDYYCKDCRDRHSREQNRRRRKTEEFKAKRRVVRHLQRVGITQEDFDRMWDTQQGLCPICDKEMVKTGRSKLRAVPDHNKQTGKVRGLLHKQCNSGIGLLGDSSLRCYKAAQYLERSGD